MTKSCEKCGRTIQTDDWYAYIRRKYCPACAKAIHRQQNAERMRELRKKTREANALTRELCAAQQQELDILRQIVQNQKDRIRALEGET